MKTGKAFLLTVILITFSANIFSQTAEEWKKLGNAESDSANYTKAIEYYQKAIETDSNYFDAYFNLGSAFGEIHEFDKAIEYYSKAITKN
ncbi:MAG: tetratricopeptide repeat protein, partial [Proteiniphilum sp.]|nr:tetratricopeptide repeat protein [Proteiniphilum sp.]